MQCQSPLLLTHGLQLETRLKQYEKYKMINIEKVPDNHNELFEKLTYYQSSTAKSLTNKISLKPNLKKIKHSLYISIRCEQKCSTNV